MFDRFQLFVFESGVVENQSRLLEMKLTGLGCTPRFYFWMIVQETGSVTISYCNSITPVLERSVLGVFFVFLDLHVRVKWYVWGVYFCYRDTIEMYTTGIWENSTLIPKQTFQIIGCRFPKVDSQKLLLPFLLFAISFTLEVDSQKRRFQSFFWGGVPGWLARLQKCTTSYFDHGFQGKAVRHLGGVQIQNVWAQHIFRYSEIAEKVMKLTEYRTFGWNQRCWLSKWKRCYCELPRKNSWWWFKYFLFSPLKLGEDSHFDDHIFSDGVGGKKPPTRESMGKVKTSHPSCLRNSTPQSWRVAYVSLVAIGYVTWTLTRGPSWWDLLMPTI